MQTINKHYAQIHKSAYARVPVATCTKIYPFNARGVSCYVFACTHITIMPTEPLKHTLGYELELGSNLELACQGNPLLLLCTAVWIQ